MGKIMKDDPKFDEVMDKNHAIEKFTALQRDLNGLYARTENEADRFLIDGATNVISALADGCEIMHKAMFLKKAVGSATWGSNEYELYLINGHAPMVENKATGRQFLVGWSAVLDLASVAGIDEKAV